MFKKKPKDVVDLDCSRTDIKVVDLSTPAVSWVNSLLMYLYKNSVSDFTLKKSEGIPPVPLEDDELPKGEITYDQIINRLKILSGLDPISYAEVKKGYHKLLIHGKSYTANMIFDDSEDGPACQISMSIDL